MHRSSISLAALCALACSTHRVDDCFPPCGAGDQTFFAECVANGIPGECLAGNRRCCALSAECLGDLDDQTVVTTRDSCEVAVEDTCWPPCEAHHVDRFESCFELGSDFCGAGDGECCALEADCLGVLGDWIVSADGCCANASDCESGEVCDPMWMCLPGPGCGDGVQAPGVEGCDDGNAFTEACAYGATSCVVCDASCVQGPGATHFCGDGITQLEDGEECDPPQPGFCDDTCIGSSSDTCSDMVTNGDETDLDCGGGLCPGCGIEAHCFLPRDCASHPECGGVATCDSELCGETFDCDDLDDCTFDDCEPGVGCQSTPIDSDGDGEGPLDLGCGRDCDDFDLNVNTRATELCGDGVDQNCNGMLDDVCGT